MARFVEIPELDDDLKYASEQISKIAGDAINAIKELYLNRHNSPSGNILRSSRGVVAGGAGSAGVGGGGLPERDYSRMGSAPTPPTPSKPPLMPPPIPPTIDSSPRKEWVDESLNGALL